MNPVESNLSGHFKLFRGMNCCNSLFHTYLLLQFVASQIKIFVAWTTHSCPSMLIPN